MKREATAYVNYDENLIWRVVARQGVQLEQLAWIVTAEQAFHHFVNDYAGLLRLQQLLVPMGLAQVSDFLKMITQKRYPGLAKRISKDHRLANGAGIPRVDHGDAPRRPIRHGAQLRQGEERRARDKED